MITLTKTNGQKVALNMVDITRLEGLEAGGTKVYPCEAEAFEVTESVDAIMEMA